MSDLSRCSWDAAKSALRVGPQEADSACNKHLEQVARGRSHDFSPEELAVMKANWERDHGCERIPCRRNPQGIMPKACKNWQFVHKRIYVSGLYNPLYCICRGAPHGQPCEKWLTDEDYLKEFIIRQRQRRQPRNSLPRP